MKLRARLLVATVVAIVPMLVLLLAADAVARRTAAEEELYRLVLHELEEPGAAERCAEGEPMGFHHGPGGPEGPGGPPGLDHPPGPPPGPAGGVGHRRPAEIVGHDRRGRPLVPGASALAVEGLDPSTDGYVSRSEWFDGDGVEIVVPTGFADGDCAYIVARGTQEPWLGGFLPSTRVWLLPLVVVVATVLLAVGPVLRRLRRLESAVHAQAVDARAELPAPMEGRDEVASLSRAFHAAGVAVREQLEAREAREEALRRFLADVTHDVMTPLTVLRGHLAALADLEPGSEAWREAMGGGVRETEYITALLQNLGTVARLETQGERLTLTRVELGPLIERVVARHRPLAREASVSLDYSVPEPGLWLLADETLLEQAVGNLVHNAIQHASANVAVVGRAGVAGAFELTVMDDGPGVAEAELAAIRRRGVRGDEARSRFPSGQGLGLAIAQRISAAHGFELRLENDGDGDAGLRAVICGESQPESPPESPPESQCDEAPGDEPGARSDHPIS